MTLYPLLFEPNLHEVVWGGNQLKPYKGMTLSGEPIGESWEVSAVPSCTSIISNGVYAGKDLISVINEQPDAILGRKVNEKYNGKLPLLVKFIDANETLASKYIQTTRWPCSSMVRWASQKCGMSLRLMMVLISMLDSKKKLHHTNIKSE